MNFAKFPTNKKPNESGTAKKSSHRGHFFKCWKSICRLLLENQKKKNHTLLHELRPCVNSLHFSEFLEMDRRTTRKRKGSPTSNDAEVHQVKAKKTRKKSKIHKKQEQLTQVVKLKLTKEEEEKE